MIRCSSTAIRLPALFAIALPAAAQNEVTERFSRTSHLDQDGTFDLTNVYGTIDTR